MSVNENSFQYKGVKTCVVNYGVNFSNCNFKTRKQLMDWLKSFTFPKIDNLFLSGRCRFEISKRRYKHFDILCVMVLFS